MNKIKKLNIVKNLKEDTTGKKIGRIQLNRISKNLSTEELKVYYIKFEKGARSKLHLHDSDQIIIGQKGKGRLVVYSGIDTSNEKQANLKIESSMEISENESVMVPAGKLHWHGALENQSFSHISVMRTGKTFWF